MLKFSTAALGGGSWLGSFGGDGVALFDGFDFVEPPLMPFLTRVFGLEKSPHQLHRYRLAHDAPAHHQYVHIIVLNALMGGVMIVAQTRAHSRNLVGRDRRAHAAAANDDAAFRSSIADGHASGFGVVRIIHGVTTVVSAEVEHLMLQLL